MKVYSTPELMAKLDGPHFRIILNQNDHRFTASFKRTLPQSIHWEGDYAKHSCSKTFDQCNEQDWIDKLKFVHSWAWSRFTLGTDVPDLAVTGYPNVQEPGVIAEEVIDGLRPLIKAIPAPKAYHKK